LKQEKELNRFIKLAAAGIEVTGWAANAAPKGLRKTVADKIHKDIEAALAEPDVKERYATLGHETFPTTTEQFNTFIAGESLKYAEAVKRSRASLDWA